MKNIAARLFIEVLEGRDLVPMDSDGQSDPYCIILVGKTKEKYKTKQVRHTLFPKWESDNKFEIPIDAQLTSITVEVYDWDRFSSDDRMGLVNIPMTQIQEYIVDTIKWYTLSPMKPDDKVSGEIKLKIRYEKDKSQPQEKNPLIKAIKDNDVQAIEQMIAKGGRLDYSVTDNEGTPALHIAAASNNIPLINVLLKGSDLKITVKDSHGNSPLHTFVQKCVALNCEDIINKLIEKGCGINDENHLGESPLHKACLSIISQKTVVLEYLLQKGSRINQITKTGDTPLHYAIKVGKLDFVRLLLQSGADFKILGGKPPISPLELAKDMDNHSIINKIEQVLAISSWLNELQLESLVPTFIQNEIFMDVLTDIDESTLDRLKILVSGQRTKLLRAIRKMKDPLSTSSNSSLRSSSSSQVIDNIEQCNYSNNSSGGLPGSNSNEHLNRISIANKSTTNLININNSNNNNSANKSTGNLTNLKSKQQESNIVVNNNSNIIANNNLIIDNINDSGSNIETKQTEILPQSTSTENIKESSDTTNTTNTTNTTTTTTTTVAVATESSTTTTTTTTTSTEDNIDKTLDSSVEGPNLSASDLSALKHINLDSDSWVIDEKTLKYNTLLGTGASGKVYKGTYNGQVVAIKVLKSFTDQKDIAEFKKEFQIVSALRAPGVVYFHGAGIKDKLCIVMEYCARGSLYHILKDDSTQFDWDRFFSLGIQAVSSLNSLHDWTPQVLHRDLKSLNLLVNDDWTVKICDFGLSRFDTGSNLETLGKLRGTYAYVSPETYFGKKYTPKSDVYSMGVILWEMTYRCIKGVHQTPYAEYPNLKFDYQILISSAKKDVRPTIPANTPTSLTELILKTFTKDPALRPSTSEFYQELLKIHEEYKQNREDWDSRRFIPTQQQPIPPIVVDTATPIVVSETIDNSTTTTTTTTITTKTSPSPITPTLIVDSTPTLIVDSTPTPVVVSETTDNTTSTSTATTILPPIITPPTPPTKNRTLIPPSSILSPPLIQNRVEMAVHNINNNIYINNNNNNGNGEERPKLQYQSSNPNLLNLATTDSIITPISKIKEQLLTRTRSSSSPIEMEPKPLKK